MQTHEIMWTPERKLKWAEMVRKRNKGGKLPLKSSRMKMIF